jgi:hypothetical protein
VTVNGTLKLAGGLYQVASVFLNNGATVVGLGSSVLKVAGTVNALDRVQVSVTSPLRAPDLRIEASGQDGSGNSTVFGNDCHLQGLVVTAANFTAGDRFIASGAIGGRNVALGHDGTFTFDTGFACASDSDCTQGTCSAGSCVDASSGVACQATSVGRVPVTPGQPFEIATDGTSLFWTDTAAGTIQSSGFDGTSQVVVVSGRPGVGGLAVDATSVYFTDSVDNTVSSVPKAGGTPTILAANQRVARQLASDGDHLMWTNQGTGNTNGFLRQLTKSTGALAAIADRQPGPWTITPVGGAFYWSDVVAGTVLTSPKVNSPTQTIASGLVNPAVVTGGTEPYFLSGDGRVFHFDVAAQQAVLRTTTAPGGFSLAAREPSLFWTNGLAQTVSEQLTATEFPSTLWRRPGTNSPRVIRQLGSVLGFTVAATGGPSSIFTFVPDPANTIPANLPNCVPGGQDQFCDAVAAAITPFLECVVQTSDNRLIAHFGYTNADSVTRRVGLGPENQFDRLDGDACQPATFAAGTHHDVFAVGFVDELTWIVGARSVTASHSSPRCPAGAVKSTEVSP